MDVATMTQDERLAWLIESLIHDPATTAAGGSDAEVPQSRDERRLLLRALMNVRELRPVSDEFLAVQDSYLAGRLAERGVTRVEDIEPVSPTDPELCIWRGDITTLATDAIVNAANSQMLGCFRPLHGCIDNAIHTFAGVQLRLEMADVMARQGHEEPTGQAKVSGAYNLPARWVIHTVGPIVQTLSGRSSSQNEKDLASCYTSCLDAAAQVGARSIAFCCISTGVFGYPNQAAAEVATKTVRTWERDHDDSMKVIFDVFKPVDEEAYRELLGAS